MVASWPTDLPLEIDPRAFSLALPDGWLKSQTSIGPGKMRRLSTAAPAPITASMALSVDLEARFWRFYQEEIGGGVLPFEMIDPRQDGYNLEDSDGNVVTTTDDVPIIIEAHCLARFSGPPQKSGFGAGRYSLQINILR